MPPNIDMDSIQMGFIIKRERDPADDPECTAMEVLGRIKAKVPGYMDESAWAWPMNFGGSPQWGQNKVPPMGAQVAIFRLKGNNERLYYLPGHHARGFTFPEFEHPDVEVSGDKNYRFVRDKRDGRQYAAMQVIKDVGDPPVEELICEIRFDIKNNALRIFATTAILFETVGQMEFRAGGDIVMNNRILSQKPGNVD